MAKKSRASHSNASLEEIVGADIYALWLDMLKRLVPEGRTHRLCVVVAGMLQYAIAVAKEKYGDDVEEDSIAGKLFSGYEDYDEQTLLPIVQRLFTDAGVEYERVSRKGEHYSIANEAVREFVEWFNYPWD